MSTESVFTSADRPSTPVIFRLHSSVTSGHELAQARVQALLSRAQAAQLLGVDVQRYTHAEIRGSDESRHAQWISKLRALHVCIDVPEGLEQSPQAAREMRIKAGLTKAEAASVVGLESSICWHAYELGRYPIPPERWEAFVKALRSGLFRSHVTSLYRRGPKPGPTNFEPGRMLSDKAGTQRRAGAPDKALCIRFANARKALRLSGVEMADVIGAASSARIYNIESCRTSPSDEDVVAINAVLTARLRELDAGSVQLTSSEDIQVARNLLRMSQDEIGRCLFGDSARPGASISLDEAGTSKPSSAKLRSLGHFFRRELRVQIAAIKSAQRV